MSPTQSATIPAVISQPLFSRGLIFHRTHICCLADGLPLKSGLLFAIVDDYSGQQWFAIYQAAMLELDASAITQRIADARTAIEARLHELNASVGSHNTEREDISSALDNLRTLERVGIRP
jgi:hypothetical protein